MSSALFALGLFAWAGQYHNLRILCFLLRLRWLVHATTNIYWFRKDLVSRRIFARPYLKLIL
jgi:hypothetical protein